MSAPVQSAKMLREAFQVSKKIYESHLLTFKGVEGYDVYNCSIPFTYNNKTYLFGRVERRHEWARSWVRLFEQIAPDTWQLVPDSMIYALEDPYISFIHTQIILGGTHVRYTCGKQDVYYGHFYRGTQLDDLYYFTTGPDNMKDIRIVELLDGRIGVFSRPRSQHIQQTYGSESIIGFTLINTLDELSPDVIQQAKPINGLFGQNEWGGCNQCYLLDTGLIGVIAHKCYKSIDQNGIEHLVYMNSSFVFDPCMHHLLDSRIIATRDCYPEGPAKLDTLEDVAFSSGIVMRKDGKVDLYSGLGDCLEGRVVIDYPFEGFGKIIN